MDTITIALPDDRWLELKERAARYRVSPEELVRVSMENNDHESRHQNDPQPQIGSLV